MPGKTRSHAAAGRSPPPLTRRSGSLVLLTVLAASGLVVLCGLGFWQIQRMQQKSAFLARLTAQISAAPQPLPLSERWRDLDLDAADLTRVRVSGTWLPQASATVRVVMPEAQGRSRQLGGFGRYLVTALKLDSGAIVLINRGFVPEAQFAASPAPTGRTDIIGIMRKPEAANAFTPAPNIAERDFHIRDPATIAAALNLAAAPFMVEAERVGDGLTPPVGTDIGELIARIPNNHLQYAFTWFGLAATLFGVFIAFVRAGRRGGVTSRRSRTKRGTPTSCRLCHIVRFLVRCVP